MSIDSPNLDDKTFQQLRDEALEFARQRSPEWTDHTPHDPGVVLVELFAYLTETLLFRLNRLPRKAYIEFLKLMGLRLQPPSAASVRLTFFTGQPAPRRVQIPRATRVTSSRGAASAPIIFVTDQVAWIEPGQTETQVDAHHCEWIEGELLGTGTGLPGLALRVSRPPIVANVKDAVELVVGVEARADEITGDTKKILHGDKVFRCWREVDNFSLPPEDAHVFIVDRVSGTITFAPALQGSRASGRGGRDGALGAVPPAGREIRAWYARGGGLEGNVLAGTLDKLKDGNIPDLKGVRNDRDATGGRAAEAIENALIRGPAELHSLKRVVTARDFESAVLRDPGGIALVKAFAQRDLWRHARPGTVDVVLVPDVPKDERGPWHEQVTAARLREKQGQPELERVRKLLEGSSVIGTNTLVRYAQYTSVSVNAVVGVSGAQDPAAVCGRLRNAIYRALSPLEGNAPLKRGFGEPVRVGDIYGVLQGEPGVGFLHNVSLTLDLVPEATHALVVDPNQPGVWYAGCANGVFRSTNRGQSWEQVFPGTEGEVVRIAVHPGVPGLLAILTRKGNEPPRIHLSRSSGESWSGETRALQKSTDIGWTMREGTPVLLLTAESGLHEIRVALTEGVVPDVSFASKVLSVQVDAGRNPLGFRAIATGTDERGTQLVALAAIDAPGGIYLSARAGAPDSFKEIGLRHEDVRVLELQRVESATYLWAGTTQPGRDHGKGCFRREMDGTATPAKSWDPISEGWTGSSVNALAFDGRMVYAASYQRGVCVCDSKAQPPKWRPSELGSGLPVDTIESGRFFQPLLAIAVEPGEAGREPLVIAGGPRGLFRGVSASDQPGAERDRYLPAAPRVVDQVLVPRDWLVCSGTHAVTEVGHAGKSD